MQKVRKAVIPAAGLGTRVLPATKSMPKEMLPIVDKPAIQYIAVSYTRLCPASTEASAPSIPATATMAVARRISGKAEIIRCRPDTPISKTRSTFAPHISAVTAASSATGMSAVPPVQTATSPVRSSSGFIPAVMARAAP